MAKIKYYGVRKGLVPGVYTTWDECKAQVDGFSGAEYKSFKTENEAKSYVDAEKTETKEGTKPVEPNVNVELPTDKPYAFVDGSFNTETGVYGYGGYLFDGKQKHPLQGHGDDKNMATMRNVAGEIEGSMAAVRKAEELGINEMTMFYDYMGVKEWATGGWKTNTAGTRAYAEFMNPANRTVALTFTHTKGHSGIEGNEIADAMAKNAVGLTLTPKQQRLCNSVVDNAPSANRVQSAHKRRLPYIAEISEENSMEFE